ncbi:putative iron/ascorbate oxidoreductase [Planoprotostelium fungivorum]|uniref:Putative iron/ascorbate oxidoreductase n=1 Tax=Planoprotostelium fungivorum TaxID=1890364 RepID=A0A2P6NS84_9EUKA|nr:putative iron/ascorbate oxidoreductase [Planoprotostelium fungivorum]
MTHRSVPTGNGMRQVPVSLEAKKGEFNEIPIIDLAQDQTVSAAELRDACTRVGFFYVKNHGVPEDLIDDVWKVAKDFFALPLEEKMEIELHKTPNMRGYTPMYGENVDPSSRPDAHEAFDFGSDTTSMYNMDGVPGKNVWPSSLPKTQITLDDYFKKINELGHRLLQLFSLSLSLPIDALQSIANPPSSIARILHYPPHESEKEVSPDQIGIGSHTDYELFTILLQQQGIKALQVLNRHGEWISAEPIPNTLVVNVGDMMQRITNDKYVSTIHRAINQSGRERYSSPVFFGANYEVTLEAGDYLKERFEATYK